MPRHHTTFFLTPSTPQLFYADSLLAIGSCFVQNLGQRLQKQLYNIVINPFGTVYNPRSTSKQLYYLLDDYLFAEKDLLFHRDAWHSLQHHGSFSGTSQTKVLNNINKHLEQARQHLQQTQCLFLTFGTAWIYEWRTTGQVVSNCHRFPAANFVRKRLTVEEITHDLLPVLKKLKQHIPRLDVVLTISPIRHLKDGFVENQISKSTLVLAVQQLVEQLDFCHYFPAYELLLDDLRDYRYYAKDLLHPNEIAVDYIWEAFERCHLADEEQVLRKKVHKLQQAALHRPTVPNSSAHQQFLKKQLMVLEQLAPQLPKSAYCTLKTQFLAQVV